MITIAACMLLIILTIVASVKCVQNFDSGLKEAIAYEKMRIRHQKMYAVDAHDEAETAGSAKIARERFALD
ncbi:hypothetical protein IWW45_006562 [Coemansia sp. RSA 485]|nr:hypothetical protein IWW45_006562 [Coemansia sp. RSA 485]